MTRTYTPRAIEIEHNWLVVDADGQTLGRLASGAVKGVEQEGAFFLGMRRRTKKRGS
jgi:ribosomal protein L13